MVSYLSDGIECKFLWCTYYTVIINLLTIISVKEPWDIQKESHFQAQILDTKYDKQDLNEVDKNGKIERDTTKVQKICAGYYRKTYL